MNKKTNLKPSIKISFLALSLLFPLTGFGDEISLNTGDAEYSALQVQNNQWLNEQGVQVDLRGINLGNWLALESWMFAVDDGDTALGEGMGDQCTFENTLVERFGEDYKESILTLMRDGFVTEKDWDEMADAGFNLVRLPFYYDLLLDESSSELALNDDAWDYLDQAIAQAKQRNMYLILDMHGTPGRQSNEHHTGCADINEFWDNPENMTNTQWLWQQIAQRYQGEPTVAAYGLLNEPWGSDATTLQESLIELYDAVREVDEDHLILLHLYSGGSEQIELWGDPEKLGMDNVAFEAHPYPGLFGWGERDYETHSEWLNCGTLGVSGVCEWQTELLKTNTPLLVGETQPWAGLGSLGGEVTRNSFDIYNEMGWAVTVWSYRAHTKQGGAPNGEWGYVTNAPVNEDGDTVRQLVKAQSWSCDNWQSSLTEACDKPSEATLLHHGSGEKTMYLAIKTGAGDNLDVVYDNLQLTNLETGESVLSNGDFEQGLTDWTQVSIDGSNLAELDASGNSLSVTASASSNSVVYQSITIEAGEPYLLTGDFIEQGSGLAWSEIYVLDSEPQSGMPDITPLDFTIDINSASEAEITEFFTELKEMPLEVNPWVKDALSGSM